VFAGHIPATELKRFIMTNSRLVHSVPEACSIACAGRTALYEAIQSGELRAVKRGRRTLILDDDLRRWVQNLLPIKMKSTGQSSDGGSL
jgi:excisionase family DNA binding protein